MKTLILFLYPAIFYYLGAVNILTLILMIYDKLASKTGNVKLRIPESTLLILNAIGGSLGAFIGVFLIRHKSKHLSFKILVPIFLVVWPFIAGAVLFLYPGMLK